jgi:acyl dehydratase
MDFRMQVRGVRADPRKLAAYTRQTGLSAPPGQLPLPYPLVQSFPAQTLMMADPVVGLPLLGTVHVRIGLEQYKPIQTDDVLDYAFRMQEFRVVSKGLEIDIDAEVSVAGEPRLSFTTTALTRGRFGEPEAKATSITSLPPGQPVLCEWSVRPDEGRRYARVSGDRNPIHMNNLAAKLLGQQKAIIHGMWSVARGLSCFRQTAPSCSLQAQFKGPVPVGSRCELRLDASQSPLRVDIHVVGNDRPALCMALEGFAPVGTN